MIRAEGPVKTPLHPEQKSNKIEYYLLKESACMILHVIFLKKILYSIMTFSFEKISKLSIFSRSPLWDFNHCTLPLCFNSFHFYTSWQTFEIGLSSL